MSSLGGLSHETTSAPARIPPFVSAIRCRVHRKVRARIDLALNMPRCGIRFALIPGMQWTNRQ